MGDAQPIKKNPYKVPFALRAEMKKQLDEMIERCNYAAMFRMGCSRNFS
jgi:hypothetical protein